MNILLTGGTGFLGSRVASRLVEAGEHRIIVAKRTTSTIDRLTPVSDRISFWDLDIADPEPLFQHGGVDLIVHVATEYGGSSTPCAQIVRTNLELPIRLLELAAKYRIRGFVNTDSYFAKAETAYSYLPAYVLSKQSFRPWLKYFGEVLPVANLVLEHVYGPGDRATKFVQSAVEAVVLRQDQSFPMTTGNQERDFIYVDDVVNAYITTIKYLLGLTNGFVSVEVGTGQSTSVLGFLQELKRQAASPTELGVGTLEPRRNEILHSVANPTFLRELGWEPEYRLEEGIRRLIEESRCRQR